jgi:hypothetical protein
MNLKLCVINNQEFILVIEEKCCDYGNEILTDHGLVCESGDRYAILFYCLFAVFNDAISVSGCIALNGR